MNFSEKNNKPSAISEEKQIKEDQRDAIYYLAETNITANNPVQNKKTVLICKTDAVGDYILFRNFFKAIKNSKKYNDCTIHFLGHSSCKDIAETLDSETVDKFFWIDDSTTTDMQLIHAMAADLKTQGIEDFYDSVIIPGVNRFPFEHVIINMVSHIKCEERIINNGNMEYNPNYEGYKYNHLYTSILQSPNCNNTFEFDNNKNFFEILLEEKIPLKNPYIDNEFPLPEKFKNLKEYAVLNPMSQDPNKVWHPKNYARTANHLFEKHGISTIFIGLPKEKVYLDKAVSLCTNPKSVAVYTDEPFSSVLPLMRNARLYIGADSSCFHMAVALGTPAVCVSRGQANKRFADYSNNPAVEIVIPPEFATAPHHIKTAYPFPFHINQVLPQQVKKAADKFLSGKIPLHFIFCMDETNTGDMACSPINYFKDFWEDFHTTEYDIRKEIPIDSIKQNDIIILGGGGMFNLSNASHTAINSLLKHSNKVIGWGLRFNAHKQGEQVTTQLDLNLFNMLGIRDANDHGYDHLPCVSCMSGLFDKKYENKRNIGVVYHYCFPLRNPAFSCYDKINNSMPLNEMLAFMASSNVIITNTWHAMYWATLLNKKVILAETFSTKFDNFPYPHRIYSGNLKKDIRKAKRYPKALAECRKLNEEFFSKVKTIITAEKQNKKELYKNRAKDGCVL